MKIAICEDEEIFSARLTSLIRSYFENIDYNCEICVFTDAPPDSEQFDLIFLDIALTESDGMSVASSLREKGVNSPIIFVTSLESRAVEGYSVSAFDFVVKSSMDERIPSVLDRFMKTFEDNIVLSSKDKGTVKINLSDILYIEPDGRGSAVYTNDECFKSTEPVSHICKKLNNGFVEAYKSLFVRISEIKRVDSDTLTLINGRTLPVSRRNRKSVLSAVIREVKGR